MVIGSENDCSNAGEREMVREVFSPLLLHTPIPTTLNTSISEHISSKQTYLNNGFVQKKTAQRNATVKSHSVRHNLKQVSASNTPPGASLMSLPRMSIPYRRR
jgi:hypothetical protein